MTGKFPATNGRAIRNDSTASTPMATGGSRRKKSAAPVKTDLKDRERERAGEREKERQVEGKKTNDLPVPSSLALSFFRSFPDRYCLIFSQSLRKLARPMSVSGCLINCSITLNG